VLLEEDYGYLSAQGHLDGWYVTGDGNTLQINFLAAGELDGGGIITGVETFQCCFLQAHL